MIQAFFAYILPALLIAGKILLLVVPLIISVALLTLMERKVIARMQLRKGPNIVGLFGILQPFADGLKLMFKEALLPTEANKVVFVIAPMLTFMLALLGWAVIPMSGSWVIANINVGVLYLYAISSLGVYGIIMAGWASNSKYAFLGAIRSAAQMVSYEVSIGFVLVTVLVVVGSLNLTDIVNAQQGGILHWHAFSRCLLLFPMFIIFFISALAETNRHPFDLPEAEGELVAGYNVEYSSMTFALFFLGEYANMILMSGMTSVLFLGGWWSPIDTPLFNAIPGVIWFAAKILVMLFVFIWVRATLPRYRYDQLMRLGWKVFLPVSLLWVVLVSGYVVYSEMMEAIAHWLVTVVQVVGCPGIFAAMFLGNALVPIPVEAIMIPAGYLVQQGHMRFWVLMGSAVAGDVGGSLFSYYIAFHFGRRVLLSYGKHFFFGYERMEMLDRFFASHGEISTLTGRLVPGLRHFMAFPAGLSHMNVKRFVVYTGIGGGLWTGVLIGVGYLIGDNKALVRHYMPYVEGVVIAGVIAMVVLYIKRHRRQKTEAANGSL